MSAGDSIEEVVFFQEALLAFLTERMYKVSAAFFNSYRRSPSSGGREMLVERFLFHLIKFLWSLSAALFSSSSSLDHQGQDLPRLLGGQPCPFVLGQLNSRALFMSVSQDLSSWSKVLDWDPPLRKKLTAILELNPIGFMKVPGYFVLNF